LLLCWQRWLLPLLLGRNMPLLLLLWRRLPLLLGRAAPLIGSHRLLAPALWLRRRGPRRRRAAEPAGRRQCWPGRRHMLRRQRRSAEAALRPPARPVARAVQQQCDRASWNPFNARCSRREATARRPRRAVHQMRPLYPPQAIQLFPCIQRLTRLRLARPTSRRDCRRDRSAAGLAVLTPRYMLEEVGMMPAC
jgi:hypothetical protein